MTRSHAKAFSFYCLGVLFWMALIAVLQLRCIVNVPLYIDSLWLEKLGKGFVKNLAGNIAFHAEHYECDEKYIYSARYYPNGMNGESQIKILSSVVDIASWQEMESDDLSTLYTDKYFKYVVYYTSDEVTMRVFEK